jgi:LysM repeat protein/ABC-type branched-subunit amino acid transport system substrate-binding protein
MKPVILFVFFLFAFAVALNAQQEVPRGENMAYTFHKVQPGETIFSISKKYLIEKKDLLTANPELIFGLKTGQTLKIPVSGKNGTQIGRTTAEQQDQEPGIVDQEKLPSFERYKVKKDDSLYFIAKRFGIEMEDILKYNPGARDGLEKGEILRIPDKNDLEKIKNQEKNAIIQSGPVQDISQDVPISSGKEGKNGILPCLPDGMAAGKTYRVGLLLPLYLPANDTINRVRITTEEMMKDTLLMNRFGNTGIFPVDSFRQRENVIVYPRSENFIHFYEGVLLAADSLKRAGMHIQLHVFDTNQKRHVIDSLVRSGSLKGLDLIIGPAFPEMQKSVADFAFQNKIPMVSPLSSSGDFENKNPWYFKVNPARHYLIQKTADFIAEEYFDKNVIVLRMGDYSNIPEGELVKLVREKLLFSRDRNKTGKVLFHEYRFSADGTEGLKALLSKEQENVFIIPSETEAQISVAVTTLNALADQYPVTLIGLTNFQRYKSIQTEYFHRTRLNYLTPYFVNYESPVVNQFIRKFRRNFYAEPNQFSFQGYDVAFYFMSALFQYGKDFTGCLPGLKVSLTQSELVFDRVNHDGGYINTGLFIMQYEPNYDVTMKGVTGISKP